MTPLSNIGHYRRCSKFQSIQERPESLKLQEVNGKLTHPNLIRERNLAAEIQQMGTRREPGPCYHCSHDMSEERMSQFSVCVVSSKHRTNKCAWCFNKHKICSDEKPLKPAKNNKKRKRNPTSKQLELLFETDLTDESRNDTTQQPEYNIKNCRDLSADKEDHRPSSGKKKLTTFSDTNMGWEHESPIKYNSSASLDSDRVLSPQAMIVQSNSCSTLDNGKPKPQKIRSKNHDGRDFSSNRAINVDDQEISDNIEQTNSSDSPSARERQSPSPNGNSIIFMSPAQPSNIPANLVTVPASHSPPINTEIQSWQGLKNIPKSQQRICGGDYKIILAHMIDGISNREFTNDNCGLQCAKLIHKLGPERIQQRVLGSISEDLLRLLETERISFESISECQKMTARKCPAPGVYVHCIYDPSDPAYIGLYIGSSLNIPARINGHELDRAGSEKQQSRKSRRVLQKGTLKRHNAPHIKFWTRRPHLRSFWLVICQLDPLSDENSEEESVLLSIVELYAMLLFRTLPALVLSNYLPRGFRACPYPWAGLNTTNPISQWRRQSAPAIERLPRTRLQAPLTRNILYREADTSIGDEAQVNVICPSCRSPQSRQTDMCPRYDKVTGSYLNRVRRVCPHCATGKVVTFIAEDKSTPTKSYDSIRHKYAFQQATRATPNPRSRSALQRLGAQDLKAWIASKGFSRQKMLFGRKSDILIRAEAIWDYHEKSQGPEARKVLDGILDQNQTIYPRAPRLKKTKTGKRLGPRKKREDQPVSLTVTLTTTGVQPMDTTFLRNINPVTFPRCEPCFKHRRICNGNTPCLSCQKDQSYCRKVTMGSLQKDPEFAMFILEGTLPKRAKRREDFTVETSLFPKCDFCFRRGYICSQGRPCQRCKTSKAMCINVTEDSLRKNPDRAKHVLDLMSEAVLCDRPCRYCFNGGLICRKTKLDGPCDHCTRQKRKCRPDLGNIAARGRYIPTKK